MGYVSGKTITLKGKLNSADTSLKGDIDVGINTGRLYFVNDLQEEWIKFTSVTASGSDFIYGGLTRGLDQVSDPSIGGTGKTWLAGNQGVITAMHDQLFDRQRPEATTFATIGDRDTSLGADGAAIKNWVNIYVTSTGLHYNYNLSSNIWESVDTGTVTANGSETAAGKFQLATNTEQGTSASIGTTGSRLIVANDQLVKTSNGASDENKLAILNTSGILEDGFLDRTTVATANKTPKSNTTGLIARSWLPLSVFGNGSNGDVIISSNTTLTSDMFYNNLTISTGITLTTGGYRIFVQNTLTNDGIIANNGGNGVDGGSGGDTGGTGGAAGIAGAGESVPAPANPGAGGAGGSVGANPGIAGGNGTSQTKLFIAKNASAGGTGGAANATGGGGAGGAGGSSGIGTATIKNIFGAGVSEYTLAENDGTLFKPTTSSGGGGGGGGDDATGSGQDGGGGGGGAGGPAGFVVLYSNRLVNNGDIQSIGGNGGNGGSNLAGAGGGGGGGGGNGGVIITITITETGAGTKTVTGGNGGTGGTSVTGTAGNTAGSGISGTSILVNLS